MVEDGKVTWVDRMIKRGIDPSRDNNWLIRYAIGKNHTPVVLRLLDDARVIPIDRSEVDDGSRLLAIATGNNNLEIVNRLLTYPQMDPTAGKTFNSLHLAALRGYYKILERLVAWNTTESAPMGADSPHLWGPDPRITKADLQSVSNIARQQGNPYLMRIVSSHPLYSE